MGCDLAGNPVWAAHGRLWGSLPGIAGICGSEDDATERQRVKETAPEQQPVMSSGRLGKHNHVAIESSTTDMSWDGDQDMRLVVIEVRSYETRGIFLLAGMREVIRSWWAGG